MYAIYVDEDLLYSPHMINEGYGILEPKLTIELNKAGSLEFILPPNSLMYEGVQKLKSIIRVEWDGEELWRGRVLDDQKDFYNRKRVYCEGELAYLLDSTVRPYEHKGGVAAYFRMLIIQHNSQVDAEKQFTVGMVDVTDADNNDYITRSNINYPTTFDEINEKLVDNLGGYLKIRHQNGTAYIDYKVSPGDISDQTIQFGVNMLDISEYIDATNVFTVLIPLGKKAEATDGEEGERLTIASVNSDLDYLEDATAIKLFGRITRTQVWDDVTMAANLKTKGQAYLKAGIEMTVTLTIRAVDLIHLGVKTERIKLGEYVRVVSIPHELDTSFLCSKISYDLSDPSNTEYTLGTAFSALTDQQVANMKRSQNAYNAASTAGSTASGASSAIINITGDYVKRAEFLQYENNVEATYAKKSAIPTKTSQLTNDSGFLTEHQDLSDYTTTEAFTALVARVEALENPKEEEENNGE